MENQTTLERIAVLIDADNTQVVKMKGILEEISTHGRIVVKKAYGDWKSPLLKNWEEVLRQLAIKPEQQIAYTSGKNATDISMVIDAMDLLSDKLYDGFVLVSSDSDFTPLAIRLRESGVYVFGVGEEKTPPAFRGACDEFILTEYLNGTTATPLPAPKPEKKTEKAKTEKKTEPTPPPVPDVKQEIHDHLRLAWLKWQDADGWVNVSSAGSYLKRVKPDLTWQSFGCSKLPDFLEKFPELYEVRKYQNKMTTIIDYRVK